MPKSTAGGGLPLLELRGAARQSRPDASYHYDCRNRIDRPHFTLQLTLRGSAFYEDARGRQRLSAGDAFARMIPGAFSYGFDPAAGEPYELVYLSIGGAPATRWQKRIARDFGPVLRFGTQADAVGEQMLDLANAYEADVLPDAFLVSARLYQLLMTLYSVLRQQCVEQRPRVTAAIVAVRHHADDPEFNVERLAGLLGCSREHLAREFRAATGETIGRHLLRSRLRLAGRVLRESDRKLEAVARASGFSNANYFCRVFRQHAGITPGEYRRRPWLTAGFSTSDLY